MRVLATSGGARCADINSTTMKTLMSALCTGLLVSTSVSNIVAASLTISPQVVTNDWNGTITLTISGLPGGQTVTIERYIDYNANGIIDAGTESLVQSFSV